MALRFFTLLAAMLMLAATARAAEVEIVSGDVIRVGDKEWRIANIDAPQMENTCDSEARLGVLAQAKLAELLAQGELEIRPTGELDPHHRHMARITINGEDVGEKMVGAGLAQQHGKARPLCYATNFKPNNRNRSGLRDYTMGSYHPNTAPAPVVGIRK